MFLSPRAGNFNLEGVGRCTFLPTLALGPCKIEVEDGASQQLILGLSGIGRNVSHVYRMPYVVLRIFLCLSRVLNHFFQGLYAIDLFNSCPQIFIHLHCLFASSCDSCSQLLFMVVLVLCPHQTNTTCVIVSPPRRFLPRAIRWRRSLRVSMSGVPCSSGIGVADGLARRSPSIRC